MRPLTAILLCLLPLVARAQIPSGFLTSMPHPLATLRVIVFACGFTCRFESRTVTAISPSRACRLVLPTRRALFIR